MPAPAETLNYSDVEKEGDKVVQVLMDAIQDMYRAMHMVESLKDRASAGRAAIRSQRAG